MTAPPPPLTPVRLRPRTTAARAAAAVALWIGATAMAIALGAAARPDAPLQSAPVPGTTPPDGPALYQRRCAGCHDNPTDRVPSRATLQAMTAARILRTLDFGTMMTVAYALRRDEREAVAAFLGRPGTDAGPPAAAYCSTRTVSLDDRTPFAWNGWSPLADNARYVPADVAKLTPAAVGRLRLTWAFGFDGDISAFGQPTVVGDHVFVGSAGGGVYALQAGTGCIHWMFQAVGPVRSAVVAVREGSRHVLLFGDLTGWFYALDAATGTEIWRVRPERHESVRLSGAPLVHDGVAYVPVASWEESRALNPEYPCCTFRGSIVALRVRDGREIWKTYLVDEPRPTGTVPATGTATFGPSGVGTWAAPTLDARRRVLYVTTGDNYSFPASAYSDAVLALDLSTGRVVWARQTLAGDVYNSACGAARGPNCLPGSGPDHDFGSAAILVRTASGRELLLAGQKSGVVFAFDPDKRGEIAWRTRVGTGGIIGGVQWGMAADAQHVYAPTSDAVYTSSATERALDPKVGGGLTALRIADGSIAWRVDPTPCGAVPRCSPALSAAVTVTPGVVFAGSLDGHLRAYATADGALLWDTNTARPYDTVNGVKGQGGAIDGPGPTVVNGMVFVNSGYTRYGGMPGNVLLAFAPGS